MSTISELFAPQFMQQDRPLEETYAAMALELGAESLRYLPVESIAKAVDRPPSELCRACLTGEYPTPAGQRLYEIALANVESGNETPSNGCRPLRTYETAHGAHI